ncbi:MAG TPA: sulfite oxidase [Longimicrobiales bacterium]|nr:sulfite oxidase [Longimicrobiales bacterium]
MNPSSIDLRVVQAEPLNAETPLRALAGAVTPLESFFVRSNFAVPQIDAAGWTLGVAGLVRRPRTIGLRELKSLGETTIASVMECAGNGRRLMSPVPEGTPWELGAVSAGTFTGVPLRRLLELCEVDPRGVEVVFRGADSGAIDGGRVVHFERSLPVARAMDASTLLVWAMNDEPLRPEHGHPVRLFVPGNYGVASVKWLERITVVDTLFSGHFQTDRYVYRGHPRHAEEESVTRMHVRSLIATPEAGDIVRGTVMVRGMAWSGYGAVTAVAFSADGGATWQDARLLTASVSNPTMWESEWTPPAPGEYELVARATDTTGESQPLEPVWNELGYANNVAQRVRVTAEG